MDNTLKTVLKVIGWILIVPITVIVYIFTLLATNKLEAQYWWAPILSIVVVAIYTVGVALRNKLGGLTVTTFCATLINLIISLWAYSCTF